MSLSDIAVKTAKPGDKTIRLYDTGGLYLEISPSGGKWWRLKYSYLKKEKRMSLGTYPNVTLKEARAKRDAARKLLDSGGDPSAHKRALKESKEAIAANSMEVIAREWIGKKSATWSPQYLENFTAILSRDLFPWIGDRPISEITALDILGIAQRIEKRGAAFTARRMIQNCSQIFRYAIATGRAERNPCPDLKGALPGIRAGHHAAITDPKRVGVLMRDIYWYKGRYATCCALKLAPMLFVRPAELRKAEWVEIDLESAEWNIPAEKMKMRMAHLVPLCTQAVDILRDLKKLTGGGRYVFPGMRSAKDPMSEGTILSALRQMGYEKDQMSWHGFRAMARTILDEVLGVRPDFIEHQLAHAVRDANGRAYNRTSHLAERKKMMQLWADYLDKLRAEVI